MIRTAVLCTALLALAACDAGAPDDELVGTWTFASVTQQQLATVSRTQMVVDMTKPTTGSFTISGDRSGSVSFLHGYYRYGNTSSLMVGSFDNSGEYPSTRQLVTISEYEGSASIAVQHDTEYESNYYLLEGLPGIRQGTRYTVDRDIPTYYYYSGEPTTAHVSGTFELGSRSLTAGQPTSLSNYEFEFPAYSTARYVFEGGGVLKIQQVEGNRVITRSGTWKRTGDRVTLTAEEDGATISLEYGVRWEGSTLLLVADQSSYACVNECLRYAEDEFGIEPGTLTSMRTEEVLYLRPLSTGASLQVAETRAGLAPPAPLRARIAVRAAAL